MALPTLPHEIYYTKQHTQNNKQGKAMDGRDFVQFSIVSHQTGLSPGGARLSAWILTGSVTAHKGDALHNPINILRLRRFFDILIFL